MAKMWRRRLRDDEEEDDDDDIEDGRYRRPRIEARQYDPEIIERLSYYDDDDDEDSAAVDELLEKVRAGKYRPKRGDHWSVHVAYSLMRSREK